jgi:aspartate kinase
MGKTTNALEKVAEAFYAGGKAEALLLFENIKAAHVDIATELGISDTDELADFFTEAEWLLHDKPVRDYAYYYDQIVCMGELLSTAIISRYFNNAGLTNQWLDVRDIFRTDATFRDAEIDWNITAQKVRQNVLPLFDKGNIILTQGFIGATDENETTTLGREGSDYSGAVFANLLDAESQTIWKDVQGVMNADPKLYAGSQWLPYLSYSEVAEMAYYGAQVIHPATVKPLQNKAIPLHVRSFIHPEEPGTVISSQTVAALPPVIVFKHNQVLLQLTSKDYSFVSEGLTAKADKLLETAHLKPALTQITALNILCVVDDWPQKLEKTATDCSLFFDVLVQKGVTLLTIRHYTEAIIEELIRDKKIILRQQTPETVQLLIEERR